MSALGEYRATGEIRQGTGAAVALLRKYALEWDLALTETGGLLTLQFWGGELTLSQSGAAARVVLRAPERGQLQMLRDVLGDILAAAGIEPAWDHVEAGQLAPGLALMRVDTVRDLSPGYIRMRLRGPDVARFTTGGLHFRLLLPPRDRAPRWPWIGANGRTCWPEGEDALHRPVYTVAAHGRDDAGDWLDFDIFRHCGSPTCDWATGRPLGQEVGLTGPGGGWCPEADDLQLFGDETALPAIARMLQLARGRVRAQIRAAREDMVAVAGDARAVQVPDLLTALELANPLPPELPGSGQRHIWFAAREDQARAARTWLTTRGFGKKDFTAVAYWS